MNKPGASVADRYWETKSLKEMNNEEWEALCDRCGRCCLVILIDDDTERYHETDVACRLYDIKKRQCCDYEHRKHRVPDCVKLTPDLAKSLQWMPKTCAYRRLAHGQGLPEWHPLLTGTYDSVTRAGIATSQSLIRETDIPEEDLESRIRSER